MKNRPASQLIYERLCQLIPGGVNSPVRAFKNMGQLPMVVDHAYQDKIVDVDGNEYIDYCGSWGSLIHGHAHPQIIQAVQKRLEKGTSFGVTSAIEGEVAALLIELIDSVEKVRFVSSGTEATMSAARLARGYTKREIIIKFSGNYHGHADFFLVEAGSGLFDTSPTASSEGIPSDVVKHTLCLPFNDMEACRQVFNHVGLASNVAAVILEPVAGNMGVVPASQEFIDFLRRETTRIGALLIFDEVISGFRVSAKGAQGVYQVKPDLTCFGKIIGAGFPVAAFGGRQEIMDYLAPLGPVYQAGTLSGNPVAMEAGLQSLKLLQKEGFYEEMAHKTALLVSPLTARIREKKWPLCLQQAGSMFTLFFGVKKVTQAKDLLQMDKKLYADFFRTLFDKGIYAPPSAYEAWFISSAHTEDHLIYTRETILEYLDKHYA